MSSVEKAFAVLEAVASRPGPVSLAEVTQAVRLSKPTVCRLLHQLEGLGYVARAGGSRDYRIGPGVGRIGGGHDPYREIKAAARPLLRRLHGALNETVNLAVLEGTQVLYLDYIETTQPLRYILRPGESDPYHRTALGRAIAARLDPQAWAALLALTPFAPGDRTPEAFAQEIERCRREGIATESGEAAEGVTCLALSLAPLGYPQAALSVAIPLQRLTPALRERASAALHGLFG